jgi:glucose/arabinose dehydrogenase
VRFDWHPVTRELWFTDHGRDWMGDDTPYVSGEQMGAIYRIPYAVEARHGGIPAAGACGPGCHGAAGAPLPSSARGGLSVVPQMEGPHWRATAPRCRGLPTWPRCRRRAEPAVCPFAVG